jgi:predicted LPLAT superfamily acyltransferase
LIPVIGYFFISAKMPRRESQKYLKKVYAYGSTHPKMASPPTLSSSFYHFMEFGRAALDRLSSWFGHIKRRDIDFYNDQEFIDLALRSSGGLIIGSHLGNIELSRALADDIDAVKMNILVFTEHAVKFNTMLEKVNSRVNNQVIQVNQMGPDTAIMLKEKVDNGELIVILGDRTPINSKGRLNYVNFLGEEAPFSQGPFILASLLECPVYLLFCLKKGQRYQVYFEHFADGIKLNRKFRQQELQKVIQKFAKRLEYYCLQEPFQWFNFFDFWHK